MEQDYLNKEESIQSLNFNDNEKSNTPDNLDFNSSVKEKPNNEESIPKNLELDASLLEEWWQSPEFKKGLEEILSLANNSTSEKENDEGNNKELIKQTFIYFPESLIQQYKSQYPYFYSYIKNDFKNYLLGSEKIKQALLKYSVGMLTPGRIEETASFSPNKGPNIEIIEFSNPNQDGEYYYKGNTIKLNKNLIQEYEDIMSDKNASRNKKLAISISLNQVLINEFTHFGDALDKIDAIQDSDGNVINNPDLAEGLEGGMISDFDEGNEAVAEIYGFYGSDEMTGLQNLILHTKGIYIGSDRTPVGKDETKIDESLIPPIPKLEKEWN